MVDIHTHLLPGVDDGAIDFDVALKMLRQAEKDGIEHLIVTPHYIQYELENTITKLTPSFNYLKELIVQENIKISIYLGVEAFVTTDLPRLLKNGNVPTLNQSKYVLVEMPLGGVPRYMDIFIYQMCINDYIPIIAHPERNARIIKCPQMLETFIEKGALIQINAGSISGDFGIKIKEFSRFLLKHNLVHFIASDAHDVNNRPPLLRNTRSYVEKVYGEAYAKRLFESNGLTVLRDGYLEPLDFVPIQKRLFFGFR